jgi:hypothetical protein
LRRVGARASMARGLSGTAMIYTINRLGPELPGGAFAA